jgi:hypothetical protein
MNGTWCVSLIGCMLLLVVGSSVPAHAQQPADSVRQQALEAFHGPDGQGKDGPLAPVGFDLALLHAEWQAYQAQGAAGAFTPSGALPVHGGYVTVDATAAQDAAALRDSLEALGLTSIAQAGVVVSGRLPIAAIPGAAALANLRALRPARAMTQRTAPPSATPARPRTDSSAAADTVHSAEEGGRGEDPSTSLYWVGGAVVLIVGLLYFLVQGKRG